MKRIYEYDGLDNLHLEITYYNMEQQKSGNLRDTTTSYHFFNPITARPFLGLWPPASPLSRYVGRSSTRCSSISTMEGISRIEISLFRDKEGSSPLLILLCSIRWKGEDSFHSYCGGADVVFKTNKSTCRLPQGAMIPIPLDSFFPFFSERKKLKPPALLPPRVFFFFGGIPFYPF